MTTKIDVLKQLGGLCNPEILLGRLKASFCAHPEYYFTLTGSDLRVVAEACGIDVDGIQKELQEAGKSLRHLKPILWQRIAGETHEEGFKR